MGRVYLNRETAGSKGLAYWVISQSMSLKD
jgi:hypothetical protein